MSLTTANILVGEGNMSIAGVDLGGTIGGAFIRQESEHFDAMADQSVGVQKKQLVRRKVFMRADLAESSLANLRIVAGLASGSLVGITLTFDGSEAGEITGSFVGTNPAGFSRTYTFSKIVMLESNEQNYQRDDQTKIPIEFEILPSSDGADVFYTMVDATS